MSLLMPHHEEHLLHALDATLLARVRSEFLEMPGLRLTPAQAVRFLGLSDDQARVLLHEPGERRVLMLRPDGAMPAGHSEYPRNAPRRRLTARARAAPPPAANDRRCRAIPRRRDSADRRLRSAPQREDTDSTTHRAIRHVDGRQGRHHIGGRTP